MHQLKTATRLALSVGLTAAAAVWVALALGVLENPAQQKIKHRVTVAKYVSIVATSLINTNRTVQLKAALEQLTAAEPTLISVGVRSVRNGLVSAGPHQEMWDSGSDAANSKTTASNQISAELLANNRVYGTIELAFAREQGQWIAHLFGFPVPLGIFVGGFVTLVSWLVFTRSFKYLDPSKVVPDRVRSALDTMAEGLVLVDIGHEIGHANEAFERIVGAEPQALLGKSIDDFEWAQSADYGTEKLPWTQALQERQPVCGVVVVLTVHAQPSRKFIVNATPIVSEGGACRGVLVSFDDVTAMEDKKHELSQMIKTLRQSRDEVERQNVKLNFLASYDQLTECMNRREFFRRIDECWGDDETENLSVIMLDIDHFKSVNDNHGHGVGDEVLRGIGKVLRDAIGDRGLVARLGGEEFVVLLPQIGVKAAGLIAEEIRVTVREQEIGGLKITVSLGASSREMKPMDAQHLLDQADQALYVAKNNGRDRVVRFDERDDLQANQRMAAAGALLSETGDSPEDAIAHDVVATLIEMNRHQADHQQADPKAAESKAESTPPSMAE